MLKVFLVEDEFVVREGIKNNIDWMGNGFEFCGEAGDGELAYPMILESEPDIIITDIRMPFLDGLALIRLVRKEMPEVKIIILSGHGEFDYAREAIKLGVEEYLLKPISSKELLEVVLRVGEDIKAESNEQDYLKQYQDEMEEHQYHLSRRFLKNMIEGRLDTAAIISKSKELDIDLRASCYMVELVKVAYHSNEDGHNVRILVEEATQQLLKESPDVLLVEHGISGDIYLLKGNDEDYINKTCDAFELAMSEVYNKYALSFLSNRSGLVHRLSDIKNAYHDAEKSYVTDMVLHDNAVPFEALELGSVDFKQTEVFLKSGHMAEITDFLEGFLLRAGDINKQSRLFLQYLVMNHYITILTFMDELGEKDGFVEAFMLNEKELSHLLEHRTEIPLFMEKTLVYALKKRDNRREDKYANLIHKATSYIDTHFDDEDISLNILAEHVGLSPSHFSTVFSNSTGKSFIRYLTDIRVGKAKNLLKCTDMRCSDIALQVGYKDPHYFSYLFKKEQGVSPMQYRGGVND